MALNLAIEALSNIAEPAEPAEGAGDAPEQAAAPAAEPETPEAGEVDEQDEAPAQPDAEPDSDESDAELDDQAEPEPDPEPQLAGDEHLVDVDGEQVTVADLKKARMRNADYTRKTQKLAERQREFDTQQAEWEQTKGELESWFGRNTDADMLEAQVREFWPDQLDAIVERTVQQRLEEAGMSERETQLARENAQHRQRGATEKVRAQREQDRAESEKKREESSAEVERRQKLQGQYREWVPSALEEAGLMAKGDELDRDTVGMLTGWLNTNRPDKVWDDEDFRDGAQALAKRMNVAKPKPKPKKPAVAPPSVRSSGRSTGPVRKQKRADSAEQPRSLGDIMDSIRLNT